MIDTITLLPGVTFRYFRDTRFKQGCISIQFIRPMHKDEAALNALIPAILMRGCDGAEDLRAITLKLDDLYGAIGYGGVTAVYVLARLIEEKNKKDAPQTPKVPVVSENVPPPEPKGKPTHGIYVHGEPGMLVRFAGCCSPVPGDEIVGYTSRGRGVVIHRADCPNMKNVEGGRLLPASWQIAAGAKARYNANISIRAADQGAALSVLSQVVSDMKLSITAVNGRIDKNRDALLEASISLTDISEVDQLIKRMQGDRRIYEVHRIT